MQPGTRFLPPADLSSTMYCRYICVHMYTPISFLKHSNPLVYPKWMVHSFLEVKCWDRNPYREGTMHLEIIPQMPTPLYTHSSGRQNKGTLRAFRRKHYPITQLPLKEQHTSHRQSTGCTPGTHGNAHLPSAQVYANNTLPFTMYIYIVHDTAYRGNFRLTPPDTNFLKEIEPRV